MFEVGLIWNPGRWRWKLDGRWNRMQQWLDMKDRDRSWKLGMNLEDGKPSLLWISIHFFCLNQLTTTLRIGTFFSEADEFPCCQNEKLPLDWQRAFTSFFGLTGCNLQLRCTDMAKSYAWYLWHWSNVPKHRHGGQGRWRNGQGVWGSVFFFIFHGLILNTDKCALFQLLPRCDDKGTSVVTSQVDMSRLMTLKTNEKMVYGLCMFTSMLFMLFMFHMLPSESVFKWPMHWAREAYSQLKVKRVKLVVDQMAAIFSLPATWRNVLSLLLS